MYVIRGKYPGCAWEDIDEFETKAEAEAMLREYRTAYGSDWTLMIKHRVAA